MTDNTLDSSAPAPKIVIQKNWDLRRKIVVISLVPALLGVSIVTTIPLLLIYGLDVANIPIVAALIATVLAQWIVILSVYKFAGMGQFARTYFQVTKKRYLILAAFLGVLTFVGLQAGAMLIQNATGTELGSSQTSTQLAALSGVSGAILLVLFVGLIGPFTEEVFFRGVLVGNLINTTWKAPAISIIASALLFGALHAQGFSTPTDFFVILWTTLMGAGFAVLFLWKKSIWLPVVAHMTYNLTTVSTILMGASS